MTHPMGAMRVAIGPISVILLPPSQDKVMRSTDRARSRLPLICQQAFVLNTYVGKAHTPLIFAKP